MLVGLMHALGPSSGWRWFVATAGFTFVIYGYYAHWRESKRGEALLVWLLAALLFLWAGTGRGFPALVEFIAAWAALLLFCARVLPRLPRVKFDRSPHGISVTWVPPRRGGKRRLRRETLALATDIHAHAVKSTLSDDLMADHDAKAQRILAAPSEEEKNLIREESSMAAVQRFQNETATNYQLFGGRVSHVLDEFERRGKLDEGQKDYILWQMGSSYWMSRAAATLEH